MSDTNNCQAMLAGITCEVPPQRNYINSCFSHNNQILRNGSQHGCTGGISTISGAIAAAAILTPVSLRDFGSNSGKPSPSGSTISCFCRICHEGDNREALVAPCRCSGTVALIHTSCLEHWLTASNTDKCEICKQAYKVIKVPRPCIEYFQDPSNQFNVRNLIADVVCFFLLTPLLVVSTYLCSLGAHEYLRRERWEAVGLVILSMFLLAVYFTWCHVTTRFHMTMWQSWRKNHQQIRLAEIQERRFRNAQRSQQQNSHHNHNHNNNASSIRQGSQGPIVPVGQVEPSPFALANPNFVMPAGDEDSRPVFTQSQRLGSHDYIALQEESFTQPSAVNRVITV